MTLVKNKGWLIGVLMYSTALYSQPVADVAGSDPGKVSNRGSLYFSWGFHRVFYTNSTIHFRDLETANYDFRLIKAESIDDKIWKFGYGISEPQWSGRIGYLFPSNRGLGLELSKDHTKYYLKQGQHVRLQGSINGKYYDQDTVINSNFIMYEHTDGANYYMLSLIKRKSLVKSEKSHDLELLYKAGFGVVIPKTNSTIMGQHRDDIYHLSGFVVGIEGSLRYQLFKHFYTEISAKSAYANYLDILLYGEGRARQHWISLQFIVSGALQFPTGKKNQ